MRLNHIIVLVLGLAVGACTFDYVAETELDLELLDAIKKASKAGDVEHFVLPESDDFNNIPQDPRNPLNAAKVQLGKMLFFETGIALDAFNESGMRTYSCGSCHIPSAGFKPGTHQGVADGGVGIGVNGENRSVSDDYEESELDVQGISPLSVLNVAFVPNTLWNGQFGATHVNEGTQEVWGDDPSTEVNYLGLQGLESQNIEGLDLHRMVIDEEIVTELGYKELFDEAFPDFDEDDRYNKYTGSFAISAYLRTLLTTEAPFHDWLKGDFDAMTMEEKRGAIVFFGQGNCYSCHSEPNLGSTRFFALGVNDLHMIPSLNPDPDDKKNLGRGGFTGKENDYYKFKVPQLYNLNGTPFYFHGSSKTTLDEVVEYFDLAIPENPNVPQEQIAPHFRPLNLSDLQKADLVAFLESGLFDSRIERYSPDYVLSGNCIPNNDPQSREELGCE